ncbi:hypothetical protein SEA_SKOG_126 [Gordonia phage Skog]|uniref:Uncharacterized protein n=1 Tax=Gordonia phage Skog TaxID=2704033 RepID=A0A6G6XJK7_9CAUD|nr:hypothetical protein KHQ85_gp126 [Gordonia phage Skog]QIG58278.1 hypothetical protein SEA_SKOG_126 [Gordonia phage Skog]
MSDRMPTEAEKAMAIEAGLKVQPDPIPNDLPSAHDLVASALIDTFHGGIVEASDDGLEKLYSDLLEGYLELCGGRSNALAEMQKRKEFGLKKYGTPLQPFNGRNHSEDAKEEMGDLLVYMACRIYERRFPNHGQEPPTLEA